MVRLDFQGTYKYLNKTSCSKAIFADVFFLAAPHSKKKQEYTPWN